MSDSDAAFKLNFVYWVYEYLLADVFHENPSSLLTRDKGTPVLTGSRLLRQHEQKLHKKIDELKAHLAVKRTEIDTLMDQNASKESMIDVLKKTIEKNKTTSKRGIRGTDADDCLDQVMKLTSQISDMEETDKLQRQQITELEQQHSTFENLSRMARRLFEENKQLKSQVQALEGELAEEKTWQASQTSKPFSPREVDTRALSIEAQKVPQLEAKVIHSVWVEITASTGHCPTILLDCPLYLCTHSDCRMTRTYCLLYLCTHSDCRMTRTSCLLYLYTHSDCRMTRTSCLLYLYTHSDSRMTRTSCLLYLYTHSDCRMTSVKTVSSKPYFYHCTLTCNAQTCTHKVKELQGKLKVAEGNQQAVEDADVRVMEKVTEVSDFLIPYLFKCLSTSFRSIVFVYPSSDCMASCLLYL